MSDMIDPSAQIEQNAIIILDRMTQLAKQNPEWRCRVLVDPVLRNVADTWAEPYADQITRGVPFDIHPSMFPSDHRPMFYSLDMEDDKDRALLHSSIVIALTDWSPDSIKLGLGHRVCGWFWTNVDIGDAELAKHLAIQAVHYDLKINSRIMLRYFDPNVRDLLWSMLDKEQRAKLLGPIQLWQGIDRQGNELQLVSSPMQAATRRERPQFSKWQWEGIREIVYINQSLKLWQTMNKEPLPDSDINLAQTAIKRAIAKDLTEENDIVLFGFLALSRHAYFDNHPAFRPVWDTFLETGEFTSAVACLPPHAWSDIISGNFPSSPNNQ